MTKKKKNKNQCNRMCPDFPVIAKNYFLPIRLNKKNPWWIGHMTFPAVDTLVNSRFKQQALLNWTTFKSSFEVFCLRRFKKQ